MCSSLNVNGVCVGQSSVCRPQFHKQIHRLINMRAVGHATAQVGHHRLLTTESRLRAHFYPCGICGGTMWLRDMFSSQSFCFPLSLSFHCCSVFIHVSSGGWTTGPLAVAAMETQTQAIATNKISVVRLEITACFYDYIRLHKGRA
jgi:hypothetical protein